MIKLNLQTFSWKNLNSFYSSAAPSQENDKKFHQKVSVWVSLSGSNSSNYIEHPPRSYYWGPATPLIVSRQYDFNTFQNLSFPSIPQILDSWFHESKIRIAKFIHLIFGSFFASRQKLQFKRLGPDMRSWARIHNLSDNSHDATNIFWYLKTPAFFSPLRNVEEALSIPLKHTIKGGFA